MEVFSLRSSCLAVVPINKHFITPPPDFVPKPCPHGECPFLPLRFGYTFAKISGNVEYEGWGFGAVKLNHDMGSFIIHIPYGPATPILAVHILLSKCKTVFGKATVHINGEQAGWWFPGIAMFQVCSDPLPIPIGVDVSALYTTIKYGFSWGDFICGWLRIGFDMLLTYLFRKLGMELGATKFAGSKIPGVAQAFITRMSDKLSPFLAPLFVRFIDTALGKVLSAQLIWLLPQKLPSWLFKKGVSKAISGGPMEDLSGWIDEKLGDAPPPHPAPAPVQPGVTNAPMLP